MSKIEKIWIAQIIIIFVLILLNISLCNTNSSKKNIKKVNNEVNIDFENDGEITIRVQEKDGIEFREIYHLYGDNIGSIIKIRITNNNNRVYNLKAFKLFIKDENDKIIDTLIGNTYMELESKDTFVYELHSEKDIVSNSNYKAEFEPIS